MCTATARLELAKQLISSDGYCWAVGEIGGKRTQLDDESDCAHDTEADADGLAQLQELLLIGYSKEKANAR